MDPFNTSSVPAPETRMHLDGQQSTSYNAEPLAPTNHNTNNAGSGGSNGKLSAGLRRSAGLFNLKLDAENDLKPENFDTDLQKKRNNEYTRAQQQHNATQPPPLPDHRAFSALMTPDSSLRSLNGAVSAARGRPNVLSLKRPHPFSSTKPARNTSGFLSRSSASYNEPVTPAGGQKRLHLADRSMDRSMDRSAMPNMTPDLSFRGAKPVQTAFVSSGLQSKKNFNQSPKPMVPETPCKRPVDAMMDADHSGFHHHHHHHHGDAQCHGSPFPGAGPFTKHESKKPSTNLSERLSAVTSSSCEFGEERNHPVDSLQRFSIGYIHSSTEDFEAPETPTKLGMSSSGGSGGAPAVVHTSTPLFRYSTGAGRQSSEAAGTATPGTAVKPRPLPSVLQSADPADSLSMSPPEPLSMNTSLGATSSSSSPSDTSTHTHLSPRTPEIDEMFDRRRKRKQTNGMPESLVSAESHSSPLPRRRMRIFDFWHSDQNKQTPQNQQQAQTQNQQTPLENEEAPPPLPVVPLRVQTPLGTMHSEDYPRTPSHTSPGQHSLASAIARVRSPIVPPDNNTSSSSSICETQFYPLTQHAQHAHHVRQVPHDEFLAAKFERVQSAAFGEFSAVFVVAEGKQRYAVKRTKRPLLGQRERLRGREEVEILRTLSSQDETHIVQLIDEWEANGYGYIMTEYCENGDLSRFLADQGRVSRLEEWRVWKILVEVLQGLAVIHAHDILHLDLKPANVFVTFEGHLKIGDFGMATRYPVPPGFEREGDREYIAPEVLEKQQYGKPADVFSVGLMMVEIAANIVLPDNGVHWHRLRSGDLSDAGRLSSGDLTSAASNRSASAESPPAWAPKFLVDDECLLDKVVTQMLQPQPENRPTVAQLLLMREMLLVDQRGQAGAVIYEGDYGPEPEMDDEINVWQRA